MRLGLLAGMSHSKLDILMRRSYCLIFVYLVLFYSISFNGLGRNKIVDRLRHILAKCPNISQRHHLSVLITKTQPSLANLNLPVHFCRSGWEEVDAMVGGFGAFQQVGGFPRTDAWLRAACARLNETLTGYF